MRPSDNVALGLRLDSSDISITGQLGNTPVRYHRPLDSTDTIRSSADGVVAAGGGRRVSSGGSVISRGSYGIRMSSGSSDNVQGTPGRRPQGTPSRSYLKILA